jgi:eukaryotic-like serine/threonine-protein kinase
MLRIRNGDIICFSERVPLTTTIGRYQVLDKVGQGGMGIVYRAHDTLLEREVALKVISASIERSPELRERFFREARAAGQLSHRNIITIHDLGEHEGQPYLAMEYLTGEDLQRRLSRHEPMSLARKLEIAAEICEGLGFAHRRGLVHRDIKPANIFITNEGVVKLLDFGLARMVTSELTASNMMLGTLNYMAPEQVRGERTDHRADIFSFGVVLYEILSGRKAFQGDSFATTLYKILQDVPEPLQNIDARLPHEVVRLVERAIAKNKEERYQDLSELAHDLALHRQHLSLSDSDTMEIPVPAAFRSAPAAAGRRPDSGHRPKSAPRTLAPSEPTALSDAPTTVTAPVAMRRRSRLPMIAAVAVVLALTAAVAWLARRDDAAPSQATTATVQPAPAEVTPAAKPDETVAAPPAAPSTPVPPQEAAGRSDERNVEEARSRMARAKAAARERGAASQRSAAFAAALAAEREGLRLYGSKRTGEAAGKFYEAAGLFRSAELFEETARADGQRQQPARSEPPPVSPPVAPAPETAAAPAPAAPSPSPSQPAAAPAEPPVQVPPAGVPGPPIPPVTRTPPPAPALPASSPRAVEDEIRDLVRRYEQALEARSIDSLKRAWPSLQGAQEDAIRQDFANSRRIDVDIDGLAVTVTGAAATATFIRRYQVSTVDGQRLVTNSRTTMSARRAGNDWLIERVRFEAFR